MVPLACWAMLGRSREQSRSNNQSKHMTKHHKRKNRVTIKGICNAVSFHAHLVAKGITDYLWFDIEFGTNPAEYEYTFIY